MWSAITGQPYYFVKNAPTISVGAGPHLRRYMTGITEAEWARSSGSMLKTRKEQDNLDRPSRLLSKPYQEPVESAEFLRLDEVWAAYW